MKPDDYFEFEGFKFSPEKQRLVRIRDQAIFSLTPKQTALLTMLVKKPGDVILYEEIKQALWGRPGTDLDQNIKEVMYKLRQTLGKPAADKIETVAGKGYRLTSKVFFYEENAVANNTASIGGSPVSKVEKSSKDDDTQITHAIEISSLRWSSVIRPLASYLWHIALSCTLYALLYCIALFIEIAYKFDHFSGTASKISGLIFLWILITSIVGLVVGSRWTLDGKTIGLAVSLSIFIAATLILNVSLRWYLPDISVTEAQFQTYTAQGAYLKDSSYFITLAVIFLIIPFNFIISLQREAHEGNHRFNHAVLTGRRWSIMPKGSIYLKVWWLVLLLSGLAILALALTAHLLENLKANLNMNLFTQLVLLRLLLFFTLGVECVIWYYLALNEIKRECLKVLRG
jgi:DNA-binding winged helix-turn-helix (wHTH) protein